MPMPGLDWLTARPVAHRGLHDAASGVIENTASAFAAAIDGGYAIEIDLQISADGEAMVHHDYALGRLTHGTRPARRHDGGGAASRSPFKATADRMMTLGELCDLVAGRTPLVIELKSRFAGDLRLAARTAEVLTSYRGPVAAMSFDPALDGGVARSRARPAARHRGRNAARRWTATGYAARMSGARATCCTRSRRARISSPIGWTDLPSPAPLLARHVSACRC